MKFAPHEIEAFAARLADARRAAGMTRREVADIVDGISEPQQLYNYEKARRAPERVSVVVGLEAALSLDAGSLCRLLGFEPPRPTQGGDTDTSDRPWGVADAIAHDAQLSREAKEQLLSAYRRLIW